MYCRRQLLQGERPAASRWLLKAMRFEAVLGAGLTAAKLFTRSIIASWRTPRSCTSPVALCVINAFNDEPRRAIEQMFCYNVQTPGARMPECPTAAQPASCVLALPLQHPEMLHQGEQSSTGGYLCRRDPPRPAPSSTFTRTSSESECCTSYIDGAPKAVTEPELDEQPIARYCRRTNFLSWSDRLNYRIVTKNGTRICFVQGRCVQYKYEYYHWSMRCSGRSN